MDVLERFAFQGYSIFSLSRFSLLNSICKKKLVKTEDFRAKLMLMNEQFAGTGQIRKAII